MAEQNKPAREPVREAERQAQPRQVAEEEALEHEEAHRQHVAALAQYHVVFRGMEMILRPSPALEIEHSLPPAIQTAIQYLYMSKMGVDENGASAAGVTCKRQLNIALATLQPVLSLALAPDCASLKKGFNDMQSYVSELRHELTQRIGIEAHTGRALAISGDQQAEGEETGEAKSSRMGSLAMELCQIGRKKKRRFRYNLRKNPVGNAIEAMAAQEAAIAKLALSLGQTDKKLHAAREPAAKSQLRDKWDATGNQLAELIRAFLATCAEGAGDAHHPGSYGSLRSKFAALVPAANDVETTGDALELAARVMSGIDWCLDNQEQIVEAEGGTAEEKKGLLGGLFGRKKKDDDDS